MVEFTIIIVLLSLPNVLDVIMRYVALTALTNIPRFYYNSLSAHKLLQVNGLKLKYYKYRRDHPRVDAPFQIRVFRVIHKSLRMFFCSWSYYFMPFSAILMAYIKHEGQKSGSI